MPQSVSSKCRACITTLKSIISVLSYQNRPKDRLHHREVNDELERFSLWIGNIGAMHFPQSPKSLEARLSDASDILTHILELLTDLKDAAGQLLEIVSEEREGHTVSTPHYEDVEEGQNEETELLAEIRVCITYLFRASSLVRQDAPTDIFLGALSRSLYQFDDQHDISYVGDKYPKLAVKEFAWLRRRLGRAITQRRHYLQYIQDCRETPKDMPTIGTHETLFGHAVSEAHIPPMQLPAMESRLGSSRRPSTSNIISDRFTDQVPMVLTTGETSDPKTDTQSKKKLSRSLDDGLDASSNIQTPKLEELRSWSNEEIKCQFCLQMKKFNNELEWRRHVFSDLRSYVCTFPNCDAPLFANINDWFRHEMQSHRVSYTCQLCQGKVFQLKERYLAHIRKQHPEMIEYGEEQDVIDIARKPLDEIPAEQCPCCSEWGDRFKVRVGTSRIASGVSHNTPSVRPTVFKLHLAAHLEQLALFAIPVVFVTSQGVVHDMESSRTSTVPIDSFKPSSRKDTKIKPYPDLRTGRNIRETSISGYRAPSGGSSVYVDPNASIQSPRYEKRDVVHMSVIENGARFKGIYTVTGRRLHKSGTFFEYRLEDENGNSYRNGAWFREKDLRFERRG